MMSLMSDNAPNPRAILLTRAGDLNATRQVRVKTELLEASKAAEELGMFSALVMRSIPGQEQAMPVHAH